MNEKQTAGASLALKKVTFVAMPFGLAVNLLMP